MKLEFLFRNVAKFIISQLSKLFFKDALITIKRGSIDITKGSYANILILPMPEVGKDYSDCREYDPTKIIEYFLDLYRSDKTIFQYGGAVIDQKLGMIDIDANCVLVHNSQ